MHNVVLHLLERDRQKEILMGDNENLPVDFPVSGCQSLIVNAGNLGTKNLPTTIRTLKLENHPDDPVTFMYL